VSSPAKWTSAFILNVEETPVAAESLCDADPALGCVGAGSYQAKPGRFITILAPLALRAAE
jgi:hypothetical protein